MWGSHKRPAKQADFRGSPSQSFVALRAAFNLRGVVMKSSRVIFALLTCLLLVGCRWSWGCETCPPPQPAPAPVDRAAIAERIRRLEAQAQHDWAARDVERIAGHYAPDASAMLPDHPRAVGTAQIRTYIERLLRDPRLDLRFDPDRVEVAASGDLAYSVGTYAIHGLHPAGGRAFEMGNYLAAYRRGADGAWRIVDWIGLPAAPAASEPRAHASPVRHCDTGCRT
jgi:uncharacterized protein (TIGR02246 family)